MLQNFQIKGFRGFRNLTLDRLGRVNLIVGKNNVGKSSLLEALTLYRQDGSLDFLLRLLQNREQLRPTNSENPEVLDTILFAVQRLFYKGGNSPDTITPIHMGQMGVPERDISIELKWQGPKPETVTDEIFSKRVDPSEPDGLFEPDAIEPWLVIRSSSREGQFPLNELTDERFFRRTVWPGRRRGENAPATVYVSPQGLSDTQLSAWWRYITLTPFEEEVLNALRIIEPDVDRLSIVTGDRSPPWDVTVLVLLKGEARPFPLSSLGDGMNRVLGLVLALIKARGGLLLIDEVENGLHYSIQADLWRVILRIAEKLDVQVFASSHSWDSVKAFQKAATENQTVRGCLIRLLRKDGDVVAHILDERKLSIATDQEIEVR